MSEQAEQGSVTVESALPRRLVTVDDIATYTGLFYTMVSQRRIPYVKVGRLTKFDVRAIDAWIKQHTVMPRPGGGQSYPKP